jgi:hypothetical protein
MDNEPQVEQEDIDEFNLLNDSLRDGIQSVINSLVDEEIEFVLCIHHAELSMMGMSTNAEPADALDMVMRVGQKMNHELNGEQKEEPKIVLPH